MRWESIAGGRFNDQGATELDVPWSEGPEEGTLTAGLARILWQLLYPHTRTPETCFFAIWEGFGCLDKKISRAPAFEIPGRRFHLFTAPIESAEQTFCSSTGKGQSMGPLILVRSSKSWALPSFAELKTLFREIRGASIKLPVFYQSANLWWPTERNWCVATEIDFMSTYVGGNAEMIKALLEHPELECLRVEPTDELRDRLNPQPRG